MLAVRDEVVLRVEHLEHRFVLVLKDPPDAPDALGDFQRVGVVEAGPGLLKTAGEVRDILFPHLATEEAALDGAGLAQLLSADDVHMLEVASSEHGQRVGGPTVLMILVHALTDDEQKEHLGKMPWFVRKVLVKRIWSRSFRDCLKYAHNPSIAI